MAMKFDIKRKACAACANWGGVRKKSMDGNWIQVDSNTTTGICNSRVASSKGKQMKADYIQCTKFEQW